MSTAASSNTDRDAEETREVGLVDLVAALVMLPAVLAHEATHAAVAWRWVSTEQPRELVDRLVPPRLELSYPAGTPVMVVVLANLAPTIVGIAVAPFLFRWAVEIELVLSVYAIGSWYVYTVPSKDDLAVMLSVV